MDLRVVITGHVDHGKSTLIGRLLHDTGSLADGKADEIRAASERRGLATEWSFAVDASQEERDQAVTIETTRVWMRYGDRRIVVIDTPGHREFIKNMMSGAADADAAVLVVDAIEGVADQTHRHAYLLQLLDVPEIIVVVNKIDAVDDAAARFAALRNEITTLIGRFGRTLRAVVPISARDGDNVVHRSARTAWYDGPTVIEAITALRPASASVDRAFRLAVQDVYRFDERRIAVGRIASGTIAAGDTVRLAPSGAVTRVRTIERWPASDAPGIAGESIGVTFEDPIFVDRGDAVSLANDAPLSTASRVDGVFFWLANEGPRAGETLELRIGTAAVGALVLGIDERIDLGMLDREALDASPRHAAFALRLRASRTIAVEEGARAVLLRGGIVVAGGKVAHIDELATRSGNVVEERHLLDASERAARNGYRGLVAWFTGLPSSGKSTLAMATERELFARGYHVYVLDGDNLRIGLNGDLGFDAASRAENVRRLGEVAALFADAGTIVLVSAISPYASGRAQARAAARDAFVEIHVSTDLATCETRDRKGLYRRARAGEITDFTGVDAPYEAPVSPELVVDTATVSLDASVDAIVRTVIAAAGAAAPR